MRAIRLFEAHLAVRDLERSIAFYRDVVGLPVGLRVRERDAAFLWIGERGDSMLGLWSLGSAPLGITSHVAFQATLDDVLDACRALRATGVTPRSFFGDETNEPSVIGLRPLFAEAEDSAAQLDAYIDAGQVFAARLGDAIVGHLQLVEAAHGARCEIKNMAVAPSHRGRGIGRSLITAAVEAAMSRGHSTIGVSTGSSCATASGWISTSSACRGRTSSKACWPPSKDHAMTEAPADAITIVDVPDSALAARLDDEIAGFNFRATGIHDARDLAGRVHDDSGELRAGVQGWT